MTGLVGICLLYTSLPKSMTYPLDSLLNDWKAKNYIDLGKDSSASSKMGI